MRPEDLTTEDKKFSTIEINPILIEDLGFSKDIIFTLFEIENENNFIKDFLLSHRLSQIIKLNYFFL